MGNLLRELSHSLESQILYARLKDGMPIEFFENKKDFTTLQISYMFWLELYHGLYTSLSMNPYYLNQDVINNEIRCDAYLKHRVKLEKEIADTKNPTNNNPKNRKNKPKVLIPKLSVCYKPRG